MSSRATESGTSGDTVIRWRAPRIEREQIVARLKGVLEPFKRDGHLESAYLFGSVARGDHTSDSDIDLILLASTSVPFIHRSAQFRSVFDAFPCAEVFVYTPKEFEQLTTPPTYGFWRSVTDEMQLIL
jgi:predicted nucleotidyltransferase